MAHYYRGADLKRLNSVELTQKRVPGGDFPVWYAAMTDEQIREGWQAQGIYNLEHVIERRETASVVGGFTDNLPAAIKFSKSTSPPGAVLFLKRDRLSPSVGKIEYTEEYFDAHPGVMAHVSTLNDGELRVNGELFALLSENDNGWFIREWGRDRVKSRISSPTFQGEDEFVACADEVRLDGAIDKIATYGGTTGVSPYTLYQYAKEISGYRDKLGTLVNRDVEDGVISNDDYRSQAELVYDSATEMLQWDDVDYHVVAVDSMNDVRQDDRRITPENFRFVYNGASFIEDYERAQPFVGWR